MKNFLPIILYDGKSEMSSLLLLMLFYLNYRTFVKSLLSNITYQLGPWSKGVHLGSRILKILFLIRL